MSITLDHKVTNDPVKLAAVVISASRELGKVSACDRGVLPVQFQSYLTHPKSHGRLASMSSKASRVYKEIGARSTLT